MFGWRLCGKKSDVYVPVPLEHRQTCACCFNTGNAGRGKKYGNPILLVMPCGHVFCKPCIAQRCSLALTDRALVPAHCCGMEFPTEYVTEALGCSSFDTYSRFLSERRWIDSTLRSDVEYAATVKQAGGMQCPRCGVGVTKISGCRMVKCFCGAQFIFQY